MSDPAQPTPAQSDPHAHDDCPDCRREKKENEALIGIYERLQRVEKRKEQMREAVRQHRVGAETNRSFYRAVEEKMRSLPRMRQKDDEHTVERIGFEMAADVIERQSRSEVYQENERLKFVLKRMHRDRLTHSFNAQGEQRRTDPVKQLPATGSAMDNLPTFSTTSNLTLHMDTLEKLMLSQDNATENSTQSSSFKTTVRPSVDLSRYNDMNLWLYQYQPHSQLEQELFLPKSHGARGRVLRPVLGVGGSLRVKK